MFRYHVSGISLAWTILLMKLPPPHPARVVSLVGVRHTFRLCLHHRVFLRGPTHALTDILMLIFTLIYRTFWIIVMCYINWVYSLNCQVL